ncbi:GNAT superfamily N-acetyltransferase [Parvibaculum indicum]|uniref:GNAT family N-acetyltransferase n=1 Tax=Parvibaculum indicum TaxID=562969 RepID=UPI00141D8339|nr:GNAT family N-acetyltransferase [Parvibaculum indicum]NIJ41792.1 GNAT superfamily N-acetyltransferase [Parvibaculum indicum]
MTFHLRDIDLTADRQAALSFIMGSQRYEHEFEPNRRLDPAVAEEYFAELSEELARKQGRAFVAEREGQEGGHVIGWGVLVVEEGPLFVREEERRYGYITELFVSEAARGLGVGQALIAACEAEARRLGLTQIMIGALNANARAMDIYGRAGYRPYTAELRKYL